MDSADDLRNLFLTHYGKYYEAKEEGHPRLTWLYSVYCRMQLQKLAGIPHKAPKEEADVIEEIFAGILTKQQAADIYSDLFTDSKNPR
jgi:hypothetical protein